MSIITRYLFFAYIILRPSVTRSSRRCISVRQEGSTVSITCDSSKVCVINVVAEKVEDAEAMKQPFAKGSESRKNYGSGLGLAIAENNLVLLGYKLDVKSEGGKFVATVTL